jgi:hypothetical protein
VLSPLEGRIYLIPHAQAKAAFWHYIDCQTGKIVAYEHGQPLEDFEEWAYQGGVYDPLSNRIFFIPAYQTRGLGSDFKLRWHYIDCHTGSVESYFHGVPRSDLSALSYRLGVSAPRQGQIYFMPGNQAHSSWSLPFHGIQIFARPQISRQLGSHSFLVNHF